MEVVGLTSSFTGAPRGTPGIVTGASRDKPRRGQPHCVAHDTACVVVSLCSRTDAHGMGRGGGVELFPAVSRVHHELHPILLPETRK